MDIGYLTLAASISVSFYLPLLYEFGYIHIIYFFS